MGDNREISSFLFYYWSLANSTVTQIHGECHCPWEFQALKGLAGLFVGCCDSSHESAGNLGEEESRRIQGLRHSGRVTTESGERLTLVVSFE